MAGLERLIPLIYHEKQQPGSMLCAQHALNNLLQGSYFTAPDLSDIARGLDELEESYDDGNTGNDSTNMDDTGFFSVQVLDNALKVWGLNLTRWRSEAMRPYQDHPERQLGFILNLEQHWFTLRRFGNAAADIELDEGNGHWFNLNSFNAAPEWVGMLYLGMVLQQAEAEGYSVFAVTQADPELPLALPRTQVDVIASTLPEPTSSAAANAHASFASFKHASSASQSAPVHEDFADEDYELQAALQASLMGAGSGGAESSTSADHHSVARTPWAQEREESFSPESTPEPMPALGPLEPASALGLSLPGHADVDPVAASMERNRVLLQRMREQQEFAQREMWSEEELSPEEQIALDERRAARRKQEDDEEEELRKAIEESEALAKQQGSSSKSGGMDVDKAPAPPVVSTYDDDDAELQAALKASLEHHQQSASSSRAQSEDTESVMSDSTTTLEEPADSALSVDEIRRKRLARFGL